MTSHVHRLGSAHVHLVTCLRTLDTMFPKERDAALYVCDGVSGRMVRARILRPDCMIVEVGVLGAPPLTQLERVRALRLLCSTGVVGADAALAISSDPASLPDFVAGMIAAVMREVFLLPDVAAIDCCIIAHHPLQPFVPEGARTILEARAAMN